MTPRARADQVLLDEDPTSPETPRAIARRATAISGTRSKITPTRPACECAGHGCALCLESLRDAGPVLTWGFDGDE